MAIITIHLEVADSAIAALLSQAKNPAPKKAPKKSGPKTADAPWGFKKDGTPKKRPGRAPKGDK